MFETVDFQVNVVFSLSAVFVLVVVNLFVGGLMVRRFRARSHARLRNGVRLVRGLLRRRPGGSPRLGLCLESTLIKRRSLVIRVRQPANRVLFDSTSSVVGARGLVGSTGGS